MARAADPGTQVLSGVTIEEVNRYLSRVEAKRSERTSDGATWFRASSGVFLRAAPDGRGRHGVTAHAKCGC